MCFGAMLIYTKLFLPAPPVQTPSTQPAATQSANSGGSNGGAGESTETRRSGEGDRPNTISADATGKRFHVEEVKDVGLVTIGDDRVEGNSGYKLKIVLNPVGASVDTITLADHRKNVKRRKKDPTPDAFPLLSPVDDEAEGVSFRSFVAESIRFSGDDIDVALGAAPWRVARKSDDDSETVEMSLTILDGELPVVELRRVFTLRKTLHQFELRWEVVNLGEKPQDILLTESGPIGVSRADSRFDSPRVMVGMVSADGSLYAGDHVTKAQVASEEGRSRDFKPGEDHIAWYALSNKYFTCIVDPKTQESGAKYADFLDRVTARPRIGGGRGHGRSHDRARARAQGAGVDDPAGFTRSGSGIGQPGRLLRRKGREDL